MVDINDLGSFVFVHFEWVQRERKRQKQSKHSSASKNAERRRVKRDAEPPTGYVHVRARRGEATDSHSLAERVIN